MGTVVFVIAVIAAITFAWWRGRKSALYREVRARPVLDADAIRAEVAAHVTLDPRTTREVLRALGDALSVDPGQLRLTDRFEALWDMDPQAGFHQHATFETQMLRRYRGLPELTHAATLVDLIEALQQVPLLQR